MIRYFISTETGLKENAASTGEKGEWIEMISPTQEEFEAIASAFHIEQTDLMAAIDPEEKNRIEIEENYSLILVDLPATETRNNQETYTTIPLGILLTDKQVITVCSEKNPVLELFETNAVKGFTTQKKQLFIFQIMHRNAMFYQKALRDIDKKRVEIEGRIDSVETPEDILRLHELQSTLVYFDTSLRGIGLILSRIPRYKRLHEYPEDRDLLDDVVIENQQAIEMTSIYKDIVDSTRELLSNVIDVKLNYVMKRLTSVTLILAIPTLISGMYGMNVDDRWMPLAHTIHGFSIIGIITVIICLILMWFLHKKKML